MQSSGGRPEGKRLLGRPRSKRADNIKIHVQELGWADIDWIHLALDGGRCRTIMHSVMKCLVALITVNILTS